MYNALFLFEPPVGFLIEVTGFRFPEGLFDGSFYRGQQEMPDFQAIYRMYGHRAFELVTVSINYPDERAGVLSALNRLHATSRNLILGSTDIYLLLAAFDADWNAAVPYTALLRPGGEVIYKRQGTINPLEMKRLIISNLVDDDYIGHQAYWQNHSEK